jgi:PAS domain S-box-containing protein
MPEPIDQLTLRHLAKVVESSDDAIISKDLNGTILSWNRAAERMFGYTAEEAVGRSIRMLIPEELQGEEDSVLAKLRAGETIDHYETIRQRKDGTRLWISLTISPIYGDAGHVIGASKIARDVSERVRLRTMAEEHATNTEKLGQVGAVVASSLDRDAIVQKVTDIATGLTGAELGAFFYHVRDVKTGELYLLHTTSDASGKPLTRSQHQRIASAFTPPFRPDRAARWADVTTEPRFGKSDAFFAAAEGRLSVRSYLAVPVTGRSGELLGALFFGHSREDVFTEQHERLATGIATWAAVALENARLYVEAREANRMKDDFLAVLSHELRTPLNAILGYARLLRAGVLIGEKASRALETLERNAMTLTQIVEDVLDVSRIVAGKFRLNVQPVELPFVVDNAVATIQPAADAKGVRVQTILDPDVGPVSGDPDRLQQVIWNLLANAVKFTPKNGRVQVSLERVNSHVEIAVSDTGAGIAPEFLPHVFERFRQAEGGTTRKVGGLGLGLAIVRHIVEMHGGTVHASSPGEDQGATFRVRLPVMIVRPEALDARREHPRTERSEPLAPLGDLTGIHVLAIDDEEDALTLLRVVLEAAGAEVTTIGSPITALERLETLRPHVMVVDLGMPEMDGFDFIAKIRSSPDPLVRNLPAAALTAFARSDDRTKALRSGFEMHLAKPVDPGELVASIVTLVRRSRSLG